MILCLVNLLVLSLLVSADDAPSTYLSSIDGKSCVSRILVDLVYESLIDRPRSVVVAGEVEGTRFPPLSEGLRSGSGGLRDPSSRVSGRGKKKHKLGKYLVPLLIGFLIIKSILLPIALKGLALLSAKAVLMSLMSLILASIVGLKKIAHSDKNVDVVTLPLSKYRRKDLMYDWEEREPEDPYAHYRDVERTNRMKEGPSRK